MNIGDNYHSETKYFRNLIRGRRQIFDKLPEPYKNYPDSESTTLPEPIKSDGAGIWDILMQRRSRRDYTAEYLSLAELSQLLWAIQGITAYAGRYALRTSPSAGALYPIETYVIANHIDNLETGAYHYNVLKHSLELIKKGEFGADIAHSALDQTMLEDASVVFIWTAVVARSKWKYGERAYRYIYMDAGHIGQNAYIAAEAMGLGCCTVGAFFDDEIGAIIGIDNKEEIVVYLCSIGKRK